MSSSLGLVRYTDFPTSIWHSVVLLTAFLASWVLNCLLEERPRKRKEGRGPGSALTDVATLVAGRKRHHMRAAWLAHLAGDDADRADAPSPGERRRMAAAFVLAAARMRLRDGFAPLWRPVDWLLATNDRVNILITGAVTSLMVYIQATEGLHALLTGGLDSCAVLAGGLYALTQWLRRIRGPELATREQDTADR